LRQVGQRHGIDRRIHLRLEIVDPEFVEIAQHDIARPAGNQAGPVVESLPVMPGEVRAALLHFDQHDGLPHQVGKGRAAAVLLDAILAGGACFLQPGMAEGAKQMVEE
jgi:hypothetical protein